MAGLGPEGTQGVLTALLAQGEHPQPGLPLCGPWHLQVTREGWVGISHVVSSSCSSPAQPAASAAGSLSSHAMKRWRFFAIASPSPALKHQAYSPCRVPGTRKHPQTTQAHCAGQRGAEHRGSPRCSWLCPRMAVTGLLWGESQSQTLSGDNRP